MEAALTRRVGILQQNDSTSNVVTTHKYTVFTFVPVCLYGLLHPMKRFANFYFLCVGAMQMITEISLTQGNPSTWLTLIFLVLVDMFFLGREDITRHKADRVTNSDSAEVLSAEGEDFEKRTWADVRVGDIVKVRARESFPADLLLLRGCDPAPGQCWVNTKPLDGESDTKLRLAPKTLPGILAGAVDRNGNPSAAALRKHLTGEVLCEEPNDKVNDFQGQLRLSGQEPLMLNESNMLLRGCQLRNTEWVLGLVIACGIDTKITFSGSGSGEQEQKRGKLMRLINEMIVGVVVWLVVVCIFGGGKGSLPRSGSPPFLFLQVGKAPLPEKAAHPSFSCRWKRFPSQIRQSAPPVSYRDLVCGVGRSCAVVPQLRARRPAHLRLYRLVHHEPPLLPSRIPIRPRLTLCLHERRLHRLPFLPPPGTPCA